MTAVLAREAFGAEFVGADRFLNTPTYGLPPQFLVDGLQDCMAKWQAGTMEASSFDEPARAARAGYAALTGVPVDAVAMGGTVSAVLGLVAAAIPDGSRVATLPGEFTSTTFPFAAQFERGVTVTELDSDELVTTAGDYDVVTASLVQSANGGVLDVDALRANVAVTHTLTVIDVTQAVGCKTVELAWADVTVAAVYKWLLAPHNTGFLYVRRERITPTWPLTAAPTRQTNDIRKFEEIGTISVAPFAAINEAIAFHRAVGPDRKAARLRYLTMRWVNRLKQNPRIQIHSNLEHTYGLALVGIQGIKATDINRFLWDKYRIITTAITRDDYQGIRVTPNIYTPLEEIDTFVMAMQELLKTPA